MRNDLLNGSCQSKPELLNLNDKITEFCQESNAANLSIQKLQCFIGGL